MANLSTVNVYDPRSQLYFYINICGLVGGDCASHVCAKGPNGFTDIGKALKVVEIAPNSTKRASTASSYSIYFENGDSTDCPEGVTASTQIQFVCDPNTISSSPVFLEDSDCVYKFYWQTAFACPVCTDNILIYYYFRISLTLRTRLHYLDWSVC